LAPVRRRYGRYEGGTDDEHLQDEQAGEAEDTETAVNRQPQEIEVEHVNPSAPMYLRTWVFVAIT
jgi:hypothetical protein